jgi:ribosomal protein S17
MRLHECVGVAGSRGFTMARSREKPRDTQRGNSSRSSTGLLVTSQRLEKNIYIGSKEAKRIRMGTKRQEYRVPSGGCTVVALLLSHLHSLLRRAEWRMSHNCPFHRNCPKYETGDKVVFHLSRGFSRRKRSLDAKMETQELPRAYHHIRSYRRWPHQWPIRLVAAIILILLGSDV